MSKAIDFLAEQIKMRRKMLGMSQDQFSEHVGVSMALISELERGKANPTVITLEKIADALGLKLSDLLDATDDAETVLHLKGMLKNNLEQLDVKQLRIALSVIRLLGK